jgi:flagellar biosynthesis protein FlhB
MAEQEQSRSEEATPFKLEEARKRGSTAKGVELNTLAILIFVCVAIYLLGKSLLRETLQLSGNILDHAATLRFTPKAVGDWLPQVFVETLLLLMPFFLPLMAVAILINLVQVGPIFTTFPMKPDFTRINPAQGFKRLFSVRTIVETLKTIVKFLLLGATLYFAAMAMLPESVKLLMAEERLYGVFLVEEGGALLLKLIAAFLLIALIDTMYSRWDFGQRMRMSRRELRDEIKRREGDPRIRQKIRELQREAMKRRGALSKVKDADVLVTNPQRLAVAVKYKRGEMAAPMVLAKGAGDLARGMRRIAQRHRIPIVENKVLARALFRETDIGGAVAERHYAVVAKILVWALAIRKHAGYSAVVT